MEPVKSDPTETGDEDGLHFQCPRSDICSTEIQQSPPIYHGGNQPDDESEQQNEDYIKLKKTDLFLDWDWV